MDEKLHESVRVFFEAVTLVGIEQFIVVVIIIMMLLINIHYARLQTLVLPAVGCKCQLEFRTEIEA